MPILDADYSRVDYEDMAKAIGLKPKHIPLLIASFIEESASTMESLKNAIEARDYEKIRSSAHAIKGSAGNLKFNEVYEMARDIEFAGVKQEGSFEYEAYFEAIKTAIGTISL
ncbi:Hpt domain-containing protein [Sulfurimonas sp.]|uniref:Hpt domain-containing protein n=1 Tax=Sulfurimonas sp. TaxID=2022749 RepID=UPI0025EB617D|nr:Hpt domain-containing protein [Sulfurimonas sp.]MBW6488266.1 Hpt domain-containing protein [Sulfurimonas sp.]